MKEVERRGFDLLQGLGWPIGGKSIYCNLHTMNKETLCELFFPRMMSHIAIHPEWFGGFYHLFSIVENWHPLDLLTRDMLSSIAKERAPLEYYTIPESIKKA